MLSIHDNNNYTLTAFEGTKEVLIFEVTSFSFVIAVSGQLNAWCTTSCIDSALRMTRASSQNVGKLYTEY